jgi:hypothetical protein
MYRFHISGFSFVSGKSEIFFCLKAGKKRTFAGLTDYKKYLSASFKSPGLPPEPGQYVWGKLLEGKSPFPVAFK